MGSAWRRCCPRDVGIFVLGPGVVASLLPPPAVWGFKGFLEVLRFFFPLWCGRRPEEEVRGACCVGVWCAGGRSGHLR